MSIIETGPIRKPDGTTIRTFISAETRQVISIITTTPIRPEIQAQVDAVCAQARTRRRPGYLRQLIDRLLDS